MVTRTQTKQAKKKTKYVKPTHSSNQKECATRREFTWTKEKRNVGEECALKMLSHV
jgi:hypothetical protein